MTYSPPIDELGILHLVRKGDVTAKKTLYCRYVRYLTGVAARYIAGEDDLKDVLQESFLRIFSSLSRFEYRGEGSLRAWMARIVVNEALKFLKSVCRFELLPISSDEEQMPDEEPDLDGIRPEQLHDMIRQLPVGYRTILNLYVFEEKSHKEIAALLNIKESTSASQFHRAKRMLADKILNHYDSKHLS